MPRSSKRVIAERSTGFFGRSLTPLIEEGLLVVASALRLSLKNHIILRALRDGQRWDDSALAALVRQDIDALSREKREDSERLALATTRASRRRGRATHASDYRRDDVELLADREKINRTVAERLRELAHDDGYIAGVVARARDSALDEILLAASALPMADATTDPVERAARITALRGEIAQLPQVRRE